MIDNNALAPCPNQKCNRVIAPKLETKHQGPVSYSWVQCWSCGIHGPQESTPEAATAAWEDLPRAAAEPVVERRPIATGGTAYYVGGRW